MRFRSSGLGIALFASSFALCARAQSTEPAPRQITLSEAVQLALKHNHVVRIAGSPSARESSMRRTLPEADISQP